MTDAKPIVTMHQEDKIVSKNPEIEWYSGKDFYTHPIRIKIKDVWEEVFSFEKRIKEDYKKKQRKIIFRCHIGDNRMVDIILSYE